MTEIGRNGVQNVGVPKEPIGQIEKGDKSPAKMSDKGRKALCASAVLFAGTVLSVTAAATGDPLLGVILEGGTLLLAWTAVMRCP